MRPDLPALSTVKREAKDLRKKLAAEGVEISHSEALETIAHRHGFRDWNALHAIIRFRAPEGWCAGGRVRGVYLSQPFEATVISAQQKRPGWFLLVLDLDAAVDVVQFDSFSNLRKQIRAVVGPDGCSKERTSDGQPHLVLQE